MINNEEFKSPYSGTHKLKPTKDVLVLPPGTSSKLLNTMLVIGNALNDEKVNSLSKEERDVISSLTSAIDSAVPGTLLDGLITEEWDQVDEEDFKEVKIKSSKGKKIKGSFAAASYMNMMGMGGSIRVPLYHSGFSITLKSISTTKLANLDVKLQENQIELGRTTGGLVFSNASVIYVGIVMDFIIENIHTTTLSLPDEEDLRDYIMVQDLYPILLGLISNMNPKGFNNALSCTTSLETVKNKPKCSYVMGGKVDPRKLLFVDRSSISDENKELLNHKLPDTVSLQQVKDYQNTLKANESKTYTVKDSYENEIEITLKSPSISKHLVVGESWISSMLDMIEDTLAEDISVEDKSELVDNRSKLAALNMYAHYFTKIDSEGGLVDEQAEIRDLLEVFTGDDTLFTDIMDKVKDYIRESIVATVGIPNYICPGCKKAQETLQQDGPFKEIIPINLLESFFVLRTLKITNVLKNTF